MNLRPARPSRARSSSIRLSPRIETQRTYSRAGRRASSQSTASGVCAPSQTSSPRRSSRPGRRRRPRARPERSRNASAASRAPPVTSRAPGGTSSANVLSDMTTTLASCATASFSFAISSGVSPSTSVCSSATFVSRTTGASTTFVASSRPPSPASMTATSTPGLRELGERGGGQRLELGRAELLRGLANPRDGPLERFRITIQALVPAGDVRRGVGAYLQALGSQQRGDRPGRGRLAVRPDHVDRREGALRISERRQERCMRSRPNSSATG